MCYFWNKLNRMKKILLFVVVLFSLQAVQAQSYERSYDHHDISISYSLFHPDQFQEVNTPMLDDMFQESGLRYTRDNYSSYGGLFLTYRHIFKNELFMWGITAGYSSSKSEIYNVGQFVGDLDRTFITAAIEWEFRYVNQGLVQVYSGLGLGFTYGTEELTSFNPGFESSTGNISTIAYQLNGVGIRVGKKFAGYLELGYGYKGLINFGFSIQVF